MSFDKQHVMGAAADDQAQEDQDVRIVRAVLHAHQRAMTPPDSGWGNMSYIKGSYDHLPIFQAALAAYRLAALEASSRQEERLREALDRQCDAMAFVLNHVELPEQWAEKFTRELIEDRAALEPPHAKDAADV